MQCWLRTLRDIYFISSCLSVVTTIYFSATTSCERCLVEIFDVIPKDSYVDEWNNNISSDTCTCSLRFESDGSIV
jgi:hypothetical protein